MKTAFNSVHQKFDLAAKGVNYHAFYRYARRIRGEAALFQTLSTNLGVEAGLPRLLPVAVQRMSETCRIGVNAFAIISPFQPHTRE